MNKLSCSILVLAVVIGAQRRATAEEVPATTESTAEEAAEETHDETPEGTPEVTPEPIPVESASATAEATPEATPVATAEATPEATVEATPEAVAEEIQDETPEEIVTGRGVGLDISTGLIGIYAPVNIGLVFPKLGERVHLGLRATWAMPAITLAHENAAGTDVITYLPWMATGGLFVNVGSHVIRQLLRVYFGAELYAGVTVATRAGLIGNNVTIGVNFFGGLEFYVSQRFVIFLEGGLAGVFTLVYDNAGELGDTSQHGATGFILRFGPRFYFGRG